MYLFLFTIGYFFIGIVIMCVLWRYGLYYPNNLSYKQHTERGVLFLGGVIVWWFMLFLCLCKLIGMLFAELSLK